MADASQSPGPGGFFLSQTLPSPAPSSSSARSNAALPHPRAKSLRPGSGKEDTVRRYVEERLAMVSRRYVKKHGNAEPGDQVIGYKSFAELCKDLHGVIDVIWLSGTRKDEPARIPSQRTVLDSDLILQRACKSPSSSTSQATLPSGLSPFHRLQEPPFPSWPNWTIASQVYLSARIWRPKNICPASRMA